MSITLETYEDRPEAWTGLQLLAGSLKLWGVGIRLRVWGITPADAVHGWLSEQEHVMVEPTRPSRLRGWDVKPWVLQQALRSGQRRATWIDSDIMATPRFKEIVSRLETDHLLSTEEARYAEEPQGSAPRTPHLGLVLTRTLPRTINTSVLSVSAVHWELLEAWQQVMQASDYQRAQALPFAERPWGLRGDQDVLTGLLGAEPFDTLPLRLLRDGRDIAHCKHTLGFSSVARLHALVRGLPPLVHAQGEKPWIPGVSLSTQLSPYAALAARVLEETVDGQVSEWSRPHRGLGLFLHMVFLGHPVARGLPLTVAREFQFSLRRVYSALTGNTVMRSIK